MPHSEEPSQSKLLLAGIAIGSVVGLGLLALYWSLFRSAPVARPRAADATIEGDPAEQRPAAPAPRAMASRGDADPETVVSVRDKMRRIGLALHNHHSAKRGLPGQRIGAGLSWRVAILPFLEQQPLYERFHLDEPWDSPHNSALIPLMPEVFRSIDEADPVTHFVRFVGEGTMCGDDDRRVGLRRCRDGSANTLLLVHARGSTTWTKPQDLRFNSSEPLRGLSPLGDRIEGLLADASLISLRPSVEPQTVAALVTANGGEVVDGHGLQRKHNRSKAASSSSEMAGLRVSVQSRLKEIVNAMHDYHGRRRHFPSPWNPGRPDEAGQHHPVSWRVMLLPFLDHEALFKQYDLTGPWDSPQNLALLEKIPSVYQHGSDLDSGETRVQMIAGDGAAMPTPGATPTKVSRRDFSGRGRRAAILVEGGPETATPWTQPTLLAFDESHPLASLGTLPTGGFAVGSLDGSVRWLDEAISAEEFREMVVAERRPED